MEDVLTVHHDAVVIDGHSDIFTDVVTRRRRGEREVFRSRHVPLLAAGGVDVVFAAAWIEPDYKPERSQKRAMQILGAALADLDETPEVAVVVRTRADLFDAVHQRRLALLFGLEGGEPIEDQIESLRAFYEIGVRFVTVTWNQRNRLADGIDEEDAHGRLTRAGVEFIKEANRLGVILDLSHMSEGSFWRVLDVSSAPVMISHTCCRALCDHPRNVTDEQIKAVAAAGGVVGLNFSAGHLAHGGATVATIANHLDHLVELVGADHVGLGPDFIKFLYEGGSWPFPAELNRQNVIEGLEDDSKLVEVTRALVERGYRRDQINAVLGGSFLALAERVLR